MRLERDDQKRTVTKILHNLNDDYFCGTFGEIIEKVTNLKNKMERDHPEYPKIYIAFDHYNDSYDISVYGERPYTEEEIQKLDEKKSAKLQKERNEDLKKLKHLAYKLKIKIPEIKE